MRHFPLRELGYVLGYVLGSVLFLAALYVGSYYAMVEKFECLGVGFTCPTYPSGPEWAEGFYSPMHAIDLKLRPGYWALSE